MLVALANKIHGIDHDPRRHTGADPVLVIRWLLESHADREALDDPDEVAGGVVRGKEEKTEPVPPATLSTHPAKGPFGDAVNAELRPLPHPDAGHLLFAEVGHDPDIVEVQRHDAQERLGVLPESVRAGSFGG